MTNRAFNAASGLAISGLSLLLLTIYYGFAAAAMSAFGLLGMVMILVSAEVDDKEAWND